MEIKDYSRILLLFLCMIGLTNCDKDGEIDINQLVGHGIKYMIQVEW